MLLIGELKVSRSLKLLMLVRDEKYQKEIDGRVEKLMKKLLVHQWNCELIDLI